MADERRGWRAGGGLHSAVTFGKVEPERMAALSHCAALLEAEEARELAAWAEAQSFALAPSQLAVHVMARETHLKQIVDDCEATWTVYISIISYI